MKRRAGVNKRLLKVTSPSLKEKLSNEFTQIEIELQKSRKQSRWFEEKKAINAIKKNSKYFYAYAKKYSKTKSGIGPLKRKDGTYIYDNLKIAEALADQYSSVFTKPSTTIYSKEEIFCNEFYDLCDLNLTDDDFIDAIQSLSPDAAPGPDGCAAILLRNCKEELAKPLRILWRYCLDFGKTPTNQKQPNVVPIYKGGSKSEPSNYRPVSLTSHIIKVFEKIIKKRIVKYLEDHNKFNDNQHGFRQGRSCLSELLDHYEEILTNLNNGVGTDTVYLDFAKAFVKVDFQVLLRKLHSLGIGGKIGKWIYSFLYGRYQCVVVNGVKSAMSPVLSGVPQGSVLGPLLFVIMMIDIDQFVTTSSVRSFADDTRVCKGVINVDDATKLQRDLNTIFHWTDENNMMFNDTKFELLRVRVANNPIQDCTLYHSSTGEAIKEKQTVKDLGVLVSNDCTFRDHIFKVEKTMRNMSGWILRTFSSRDECVMLTAWKTLVIPHHDYCSQLWSPYLIKYKKLFEQLQYNFLKKIKGMNNKSYDEILKKLRVYSLERRRDRYRVIYTWKILEGLVPGMNLDSFKSERRGRLIKVPSNMHSDQTFKTFAIKAWNELPRKIRDLTKVSVDTFKSHLDKHLLCLEDYPHIQNEKYRRCGNDLISVMRYQKEEKRRLMGSALLSTLH